MSGLLGLESLRLLMQKSGKLRNLFLVIWLEELWFFYRIGLKALVFTLVIIWAQLKLASLVIEAATELAKAKRGKTVFMQGNGGP